jgi:hypothetical protein
MICIEYDFDIWLDIRNKYFNSGYLSNIGFIPQTKPNN